MKIWKVAAAAVAAVGLTASAQVASAQEYPNKPIHIIVGYGPGGSTDTAARVMSLRLEKILGQPIVVENRPGAAAMIAHDYVSRAEPDGYTLIISATGDTIAVTLNPEMPYKYPDAFEPIARLTRSAFLVVVPTSSPVESIADLIELAKTKRLTFGSSGLGTPSHLGAQMLLDASNVEGTHVPYKGAGPLAAAVMGGEIDFAFANMSSSLSASQEGRLRAIAQSSETRSTAAADVPTVAESGIPGFNVISWAGIDAPAGTPGAIVKKLSDAALEALAMQETQDAFEKAGTDTYPAPSAEYAAFLNSQVKQWKDVIDSAGITMPK